MIRSIDPGIRTGLAKYDPRTRECSATDTEDVNEVTAFLLEAEQTDEVVVEAFPGSGPRTAEVIHTLKLLGFVEHFARWRGLSVEVQQPQVRLHRGEDAKRMLGTKASTHMIAALAHALAYSARHPYDEFL